MPVLKPPSSSEIIEQRKVSPRILRSGDLERPLAEQELIPFVPAYDLLEQIDGKLSAEEAACVALALFHLLPGDHAQPSIWLLNARREAIYKD